MVPPENPGTLGGQEAWSTVMDKAEQQQTQSVASPANATSSGQHGPGTWAAVLGRTLGLNKNVLEVVLEKDARGSFTVGEIECANLIRRL